MFIINLFIILISASPSPIIIHPDQNWDGIDGEWSSFTLQIGTPPQFVRTFISFAAYQTWVVGKEGCISDSSDCSDSRGWLWDRDASSSFEEIGIYDLWIERHLNYTGNAIYGYDALGLGGVGEGGPTLLNTTIGTMAVEDFWVGIFGINPKPTNFTSFENGSPSYMTQLKEGNHIPSLSFGYHAGARYRFTGVLASLTLGGFDASISVENNVTFKFAPDNERDLVVAIQSITTPSRKAHSTIDTELLPSPIYAYIDSTIPEIWLPIEACMAFEIEFGLIYDDKTKLYVINEKLHEDLLNRNANVTFNLGPATSGGDSISIVLPYAAFDIKAKPPYKGFTKEMRYFPLQRAPNDGAYTLGRAFLQEAYMMVDWERAEFKISQMNWKSTPNPEIITINPVMNRGETPGNIPRKSNQSHPELSNGAIGGVAVAAIAVIALIGVLFMYWMRRKKTPPEKPSSKDFSKPELEGSSIDSDDKRLLTLTPIPPIINPSSPGSYLVSPLGITPTSTRGDTIFSPLSPIIYEMPGDMPTIREKDGKALSEKEACEHREKIYNGIPSSTTTIHRRFSYEGQESEK
jgi:hypothetical protein